jgi:arylformamidase
MRIYDISMPLQPGIVCWPGDATYEWAWTCQTSAGAEGNVGKVSMSVHTGTHTDAPFHFSATGTTIEAIDPAVYVGPARVLDVRSRDPIRAKDLAAMERTPVPRVLLHTGGWEDRTRFPERLPALHPEVPAWLASHNVLLLGVDIPSVDAIESVHLPIHHALGDRGITILENLVLDDVPEGIFELIALPLRLVGGDGSPVRAVLREVGLPD